MAEDGERHSGSPLPRMQVRGMSADGEIVTLAQFVLARIADAEQAARDAERDSGHPEWETSDLSDSIYTADTGTPILSGPFDYLADGLKAHVIGNDPACVLARCAADRQTVADFLVAMQNNTTDPAQREENKIVAPALLRVVARLATVHSEHPDYRAEAWALDE